ncbi:thymidine phosphorylase family protein [Oceanospirillum sediminis]|uniref:Putative thymidine phosphorylase n=1 Tax=Oceanospirillum sediminis TaxID=2760088 RepID=A0A839IXY8_9GAMM|nr:thymidine phosphorylase family protein [Oceanospirillum sediminis]MBB1488946.1 thymidine phosphorylase family protein [Oceanospirillum sediminis]
MTAVLDTESQPFPLVIRRLGIDSHQEPVVYLRRNSHICRAEGFATASRVQVSSEQHSIIASLHIIDSNILSPGEIGLSESAYTGLKTDEGHIVHVCHPSPIHSLSALRHKVYGHTLDDQQMSDIIDDIVAGHYSDVHLATFITACAGDNLNQQEIISLTRAMLEAGDRLDWQKEMVVDKHCVGGLPGNRTTPIVVSIVTACGAIMPKTSSRAITSPAGTADTMSTMTEVELEPDVLKQVVNQEGGCLAWGGSVHLSPADDILIKAERELDLDSEGQMVASVLSKKIAAGSSHVLIDIPVGPTAKVRSQEAADLLSQLLITTGQALGLTVEVICTDGSQPVGRGIGPALEARDIIRVLKNQPDAPEDLRHRALVLAGHILEMAGIAEEKQGFALAEKTLMTGRAWQKFYNICQVQGGFREPAVASYQYTWHSPVSGTIAEIDNRNLAKLAKLAGAPEDLSAGVTLEVKLKQAIRAGDPLLEIHAESPGALNYAVEFLNSRTEIIKIQS